MRRRIGGGGWGDGAGGGGLSLTTFDFNRPRKKKYDYKSKTPQNPKTPKILSFRSTIASPCPGSNALMSTELLFPVSTSSEMIFPVTGAHRMPQQLCPHAWQWGAQQGELTNKISTQRLLKKEHCLNNIKIKFIFDTPSDL